MRKIHVLLTMLMLMAFSVGTMWADDLTVDFESATSSYSDWTFVNFLTQQTNSNVQAHGGSYFGTTGAKATGSLQTVNKIANPTSITFYYSKTSTNTTASSWSVEVSEDGANWTQVGATNSASSGVTRGTWYEMTRDLSDYSNVYVRIYYNGTTAVRCLDDVVLSYTSGSSSTTPSISIKQKGSAVTSVNFGEVASYTETENQGYVVCQSVDIKASNLNGDVYLEVENSGGDYFSIYDPRYAVTSWDKFTIKPTAGAIDTTIVLKAATWMSAGTKTGKLKVSSKASTADFTALNIDLSVTVFDPAEGDYDISLNNTFFGLSATGANPDEQTGSQDGITLIAGCTSTAQNKTYYDAAHVRFYGDSYLQICAPYGFVVDAVTFTAGGTWNGGISADAGDYDADKKEWTGSSSCVTFSFTAQDRISKATVSIIKAPTVGLPTISGQTPFYPSTTVTMSIETDGADIIYTMNGEDPLGGDNTYSQPIVLTETKTIKARGFKGVELGNVVTKVFTKATPISVTDAIELIPNENDTKDDTFVYGYVCTLSTADPSNGQMTYYISKDGTETNRLQIYKGKGLNNADFSAISDIALGDKVVIYGQLKNYNGTYEFNTGSYIVERTAKGAVTSLDLTGTNTKTEFEYGDHFDPATDGSYTAKAIYANGYSEDVTSLVTWDIDGKTLEQKEIQGSGSCALTATYSGKSDWVYINISKILKHKITFAQPDHGTLVVKWLDSAIESPYETYKTYEFKVIATPAAGYELATLTANGVDIKDTKAFVMGTEDIVVAATFSKKAEGVLKLYNNGVVDFGAVKVGTTSVGTGVLRIDATKLTPNSDLEVSIDGTDGYFEVQVPSDGKIDVDENGEIDYFAINIAVTSTALATYGEKTATLRLHSNDLAADSLATIKLIVGGVVSTTPSPVALDLGDVLNNDEPTLYGKTFHVKVTNLSANKQARVVPSTGSFYADPYYLTADGNGVIDRDVTILPYLNGGGAAVYNADLEVVCTGTREFKDIKVGTVTMNLLEAYSVIVPDISNGSLSWDGGAAPKAARPGTTHTLVAVPASGYDGGTIKILKNSDDSDVTSTVMSGSTLTMPSYAIKVVVSGFEAQAHPSGLGWRYGGADVTTHAHTFGASTERFYFPSLKNPNEIDLNDIEFISSDSTVAEFGTRSHENSSWFAAVWVKKAGTAIMTARLKNHATYDDIEVSYTLTVSKGDLTSSQFRWSQYPDIENPETDTYTWYESHSWPSVVATSYVDKANEVTYESTNTGVATISSTGSITPVANGSTVIKAKFIGNDMFNAKTVQFTLNVQKASPVLSWSTTPTTANTTVDMADSYDIYTFPRFGSVSPYVDALKDLVVLSSSNTAVAEINSSGYVNPLSAGTTTIKLSLAATDKSNAAEELSYTFTVTDSRPTLTIVAGDHGTYNIKDYYSGHAYTSGEKVKASTYMYLTYLSVESGYKTPVYKVVKTSDNTDVTASVLNGTYLTMPAYDITVSATFPEKAVAPIGWSSTETQYAYTDNRPYTLPTLVNAGLSVTFASSNTNVATISYDGKVSVWSAGTTNISVSYAGDGTYKQTTVSYELVVRAPNHLNVKGQPTKLMYDYGETINFTGMTATLYYDAEKTDGVDVTDVANWYSTPATVTASGNMTLSASYKGKDDSKIVYIYLKQYEVTFSNPANAHGTIVVKNNGTAINSHDAFPKGTVLTVEATPDAGYALATLTANGDDIMSSKQITIGTTEVTIVATFKQGPSLVSNTYSIDFGEAIQHTTDNENREYLSSTFILTGANLTGDIRLEATTTGGGAIFSVDWKAVKEYSPVDGAFYLTIPTQMATGWIGDFYGKITISSKANPADFEPVVINLHGKITDKHEPGLSWGVSEYHLYPVGPASTTRPELSNPNNLNVTYSSSNTAVATVSAGGWVSVVASGDAVITASYAGNDEYKAGEASYTVHVHKANSIQIKGGLQKTYDYEAGDQLDFTGLIAKLKYDGDDNTYQLGAEVEWSADPISVNMLPDQCGLTVTASAYGVSGTREVSVTVNLHAVTFTNPQYGYLSIKKGDSWISSGESFPKGTELTVVATPVEGYELNSITVNDEALEGNTFTVGAEAMEVVVTFKPKSGTAIDQTEAEMRPTKIIRDNKVYILRGDKIYSIQGHLVQ